MRESELLRAIHLKLGSRSDVRLWRYNAGLGWVKDGAGFHPQRFVPTGHPDLAGVVLGGKWLGIEVKSERGRMSEAQQRWAENVRRLGGIYIVARGADEAEEQLEEEMQRWRLRGG